jgi:hypothetical protein
MNRQKIRMIVLAVLLVAGGAYLWMQQSASAVKPAQTAKPAANKPLAPTATKAPAAKPAAAPAPGAAAAANTANKPAAVPQAKAAAPAPAAAAAPVPAAKPAPVPQAHPAVNTASAKPAAASPAAAASAPAAPAPAPMAPPVEAASWQDHLQKGAYLAERLRTRLPEGTDLVAASAGFSDLQQFAATVNAAHNLKLNFDELKRRVVTDRKGLASAIDAMKKVASATIEEQRAEYEARGLIQEAKRHPLPAAPAPRTVSTKAPAKKPIRSRAGV